METKEITRLDLAKGGTVFRQGHYETLAFTPRNEEGEIVDLTGKTINVVIVKGRSIVYDTSGTFDSSDNTIHFTISENFGYGDMWMEITVTDPNDASYRQKFPTSEYDGRLKFIRSTDDADYVGFSGKTVAKFEADQTEFKNKLQNDFDVAVAAVTADSEVALARKEYTTLGLRLDAEKQETAGQLAEKASKQDLANIGDAKPSGVFATLASLQTTFPTGNGKNIFLVTADGKWYYWNGLDSWVAGGIYQSTGLAKNSVSYENLGFLSTSRINLLDRTKMVEGYISSTGTISGSTGAHTTDFMPVEYGQTYQSQAVGTGVWGSAVYDANKIFIRKFDINKEITITDTNAALVRLVYQPKKTLDFDLMFVKGSLYPDEYIPFQLDVTILDNDFKRLLLSQSFKEEYVNLMDKTNYFADGGISVTTGAEVTAAGGKRSWFLPVEHGKLYVGNFWNYQLGACYDANKNYLCSIIDGIGKLDNNKPQFYLKRNDISYIRVTFSSSAIPFVGLGTAIPATIAKGSKKVDFVTVEFKAWIQKTLDVNRPLSGLKMNVIGDSIVAAPGLTRNWHGIISEQENIFVRNYGVSGTRITLSEGQTAGSEISTRFASMDNDADINLVSAGINDMNNSVTLGTMGDRTNTTFYGALHVLLSGLHKKYLGNGLGFISPMNYGNPAHEPYRQAIREVCNWYSVPLLDMQKVGLLNTVVPEVGNAFFSDGLHLNESGHDVKARIVKPFLLTL